MNRLFLASFLGFLMIACGPTQVKPDGDGDGDTNNGNAAPGDTVPPTVKKEARELFELAAQAQKQNNQDKAIDHLKNAIESQSDLGAAYYNIGKIYEKQGDLEQAKEWYNKSSEKGKEFGAGYIGIAKMYLDQGKRSEAEGMIQKALKVEPLNEEAHLNLAEFARQRKDYPGAVKHIRTALKSNSQNVKAYEVLGRVYYDLGRPELSKLVCEAGLQIDKDYAPLNNILGLVYLKLDNVTKAIAAFEDAVKSNPKYVPSLSNLGALTFGYRDYESSYRYFGEVIKVEPKNIEAILSKAVSARALDRVDEAEKGYKEVINLEESNVGAHYNLGILYQEHKNQLEDAIKEYKLVLQYDQRNAELRKDVSQRIQSSQIQIQNQKELAEDLAREKARQEAEKKNPPPAEGEAQPNG
ncbi:tetratricopeptide repeat protein [Myxococcota bacterium]|nr:tetratricopeptide repeat protein [Myxococcota bacterium]